MTTCTWIFRRHARPVVGVICTITLASGLAVPRASADQISDLKAQASALASRIQDLGRQEAALSEQYDADQLKVQALEQKVSQSAKRVMAANASASRARTALQADAINAYVHGGSNPLTAGGTAISDATNGLLRAEYVNSLATNQSDAIDQYRLAAVVEQSAKTDLQRQTDAVQSEVKQVGRDRQAAFRTQAQLQGVLNQDTGRIAVLVAQQQAAAAAAAAAAERARIAAQQRAAQAAAAQAAAAAAASARQVAAQAVTVTAATPPSGPAQAAVVVAAPAPAPVVLGGAAEA